MIRKFLEIYFIFKNEMGQKQWHTRETKPPYKHIAAMTTNNYIMNNIHHTCGKDMSSK